jgi:hypothetical protein
VASVVRADARHEHARAELRRAVDLAVLARDVGRRLRPAVRANDGDRLPLARVTAHEVVDDRSFAFVTEAEARDDEGASPHGVRV